MTQQDLSDYTGFGVRVIKSIEVEKGSPSLNMLEEIANS
ncbi:MAG: helix-turn-helix domain-containing protein [Butyricimonas faecalis]|nr:helix-turn-helix transcriptional regulator [Sanguibacteroides justesenii]